MLPVDEIIQNIIAHFREVLLLHRKERGRGRRGGRGRGRKNVGIGCYNFMHLPANTEAGGKCRNLEKQNGMAFSDKRHLWKFGTLEAFSEYKDLLPWNFYKGISLISP